MNLIQNHKKNNAKMYNFTEKHYGTVFYFQFMSLILLIPLFDVLDISKELSYLSIIFGLCLIDILYYRKLTNIDRLS